MINPFDFFLEPYAEKYPFCYEPTLERELAPFRQVRPAGKPTLEQLDFLLSKYQRGAIALVAYSIDDVTSLLGDRLERNYRALRREVL